MLTAIPLLLAQMTAALFGTGIDGRQGIFIQEFHQGEQVRYLIANTAEKPAKISVVKFDPTWRIGQPIGKVLAGPWEVPANRAVEINVTDLSGDDMLRFFNAEGSPLGVLQAPRKPAAAVGLKAKTADGGLNGMGNYVDGVTVSLPANAVPRDKQATARLVFKKNVRGVLTFKPLAAPNPAAGPQLHPESVTCGTLPVRQEGQNWVIDLNKPDKDVDEHVVELTFAVAADHAEPLFVWSGWLANAMGGGMTIARGVEVK